MKRYGGLWPAVVDWSNLLLAARKARRGKRRRDVVARFEFNLETELLRLQRELMVGSYQPGPFVTHWISRPKPRLISAAPYRDRVVHHAIMNVLEPILEKHFHPDSYACRRNKGTHAASRRLQRLRRRYRWSLHGDVCKFFPSIDHEILKDLFRRRFKDQKLLALLDTVVNASNEQEAVRDWFPGDTLLTPIERRRGLPIGNLTSQWFANWYLDGFDHLLGRDWRVGGQVRYCDDFVVLDNDQGRLRELRGRLVETFASLRLKLHLDRLRVHPGSAEVTFVGYRTTAGHRLLPNAAVRRFLRREHWLRRAFLTGRVDRFAVHQRIMSWLGHAGQGDSLALLHQLTTGWQFRDGIFNRFS